MSDNLDNPNNSNNSNNSNTKKRVLNITKKQIQSNNEPNNEPDNESPKLDINKLVQDILDRKIIELLKTIHYNYPNKFQKKDIQSEYKLIKQNISIGNYKIPSKSKTTQITSNNSNTNTNTNTNTNANANTNANKEITKNKKIDNENRCCARIWNNIYERQTLSEVSDILPIFKVKDFADINIKAFNNQYILGTQCKRKKNSDSTYCFQHKQHSPHGNYFELPTQEICFHYLKDCNYI